MYKLVIDLFLFYLIKFDYDFNQTWNLWLESFVDVLKVQPGVYCIFSNLHSVWNKKRLINNGMGKESAVR